MIAAAINGSYPIQNADIWQQTGIIVPAVMTLICFICTAVSLTVSGFICLRDREAQDDTDNKAKHHKEQEYVSKVLGLFYKIRTSNVFRIKEVMQDLNEERPVWIGTKSEIICNLEYFGTFLDDTEKAALQNNIEVFEIDCESLFYFEMERFSKAQALFGTNVLNYFECIQQDGSSFPREFYPDLKPVYHMDIVYNVFTEMQTLTELFVLLATGIDLEIISVYSIPPQFKHSKIGLELEKIKDFLYNYYLRVYPKERSTATVIKLLPQLPVIYEPIEEEPPKLPKTETIETITEEVFEEEQEIPRNESPAKQRAARRTSASSAGSAAREPPVFQPTPIVTASPPPRPQQRSSTFGGGQPPPKSGKLSSSFGKHKLKMVKVYKTLAERVRQRPYTQNDDVSEEEEDEESAPVESPAAGRGVRFEEGGKASPTPSVGRNKQPEPLRSKKIRKKITRKKQVTKEKEPEPVMTQEAFYEAMRFRYKAPVKRDPTRRRGNLSTNKEIEHNAFTYMVTRVIGFLLEKGDLGDEELNSETYNCVEKNFII